MLGGVGSFIFDLAPDDTRAPCAGDLLVTARLVYRVTFVRPVDSRVWDNRWALTVTRLGARTGPGVWAEANAGTPEGARCWHSARYARGETPQSFYAQRS